MTGGPLQWAVRGSWPPIGSPASLSALWHYFGIYFQRVPEDEPPSTDWQTGQPYTYDVDHSDGFLIIDSTGREGFLTAGRADLHGQLSPTLAQLLDSSGGQNLARPGGNSWTVADGLSALGWVGGRTIPSSPTRCHDDAFFCRKIPIRWRKPFVAKHERSCGQENGLMTYQRTTATERPYRRPAPSAATGPLQRLWAAQDLAPLPIYLLAAVLCLAIAVIHIQDQGGFLGNVTPEWIAVGYYVVEAVAAVAALLFARQHSVAWLLGLAVSAGPATGYILSRSVGLPGDSGDVGNWGYVLGTVSLVAEGTLFVLCAAVVIRAVANERARLEPRRPSLAANL